MMPTLELEIRGRRPHFEGPGALRLSVDPHRGAQLAVRVKNETSQAHHLELGGFAAVRPAGLQAVTIQPGESAELRLEVEARPGAEGSFVAAIEGDSRTVTLALVLAPEIIGGRRKRRLMYAILLAILSAGYGTWLSNRRDQLIERLSREGVPAVARVTRLTPSNHHMFWYEYSVGDETFEKGDYLTAERVGDPIEITYLPGQPSVSVRGRHFQTAQLPGFWGVALFILLFGTAGLVGSVLLPAVTRRDR